MSQNIDNLPHMDEGGLACFKEALARSKCYLEYGCGGSTLYACNEAKVSNVISVDSDQAWVAKVKTACKDTESRLLLSHCDLGEVGEWGRPKSNDRYGDFWKYAVAPWRLARPNHLVPDTILIDGRFRVASFLYSLLSARAGATLLFDDYLDRPHYFVVEQFATLQQTRGRMGVFLVAPNFSVAEVCEKIAQYSVISD